MSKKVVEKETVEESKKEGQESENLSEKDKKEVRVIERIIEDKEIAPIDAFGKLTKAQIDLVKRTVAKGSSDDELRLFLQVCKGANLNPFLKQVHLIPRWDSKEGRETRTIQVSIDGFRSIAESSGNYAGNDDVIFKGEKEIEFTKGKDAIKEKITVPLEATVSVYKVVQGQRYPFTATARWDEYYPGAKMGFQWHIRPKLMLGKCAEALALRKAFPKLLSGMYAQEEMEQAMKYDADAEKNIKGFMTLKNALNTVKLEELEKYKDMMEKSDRYTQEQKDEYLKLIEVRRQELNP